MEIKAIDNNSENIESRENVIKFIRRAQTAFSGYVYGSPYYDHDVRKSAMLASDYGDAAIDFVNEGSFLSAVSNLEKACQCSQKHKDFEGAESWGLALDHALALYGANRPELHQYDDESKPEPPRRRPR